VYTINFVEDSFFTNIELQSNSKIQGPIDIASLHWPDGIWEYRDVLIAPRFHADD